MCVCIPSTEKEEGLESRIKKQSLHQNNKDESSIKADKQIQRGAPKKRICSGSTATMYSKNEGFPVDEECVGG